MSEDAFFTTPTIEFLREQRKRSEEALAAYREQLKRAAGWRADFLKQRIAGAEAQVAAIDAEFKRRGIVHA